MQSCFARLLFIFLTCQPCFAQPLREKDFLSYSAANGLSGNFVTGLAQDKYGYIWISTTNGLNRFDGKEFKQYYQTSDKKGLLTDNLRNVVSDGEKLLLYSNKGAQWMDVAKNRFTNLIIDGNGTIAAYQNQVEEATYTDGGVCVETTYTGAYAFDSTGELRFRYEPFETGLKQAAIGSHYGKKVVRLDGHRVLHLDNTYNLSIYDSRRNSFLPIDAYKNSLPGLYSLKGNVLIMGSRLSKSKIVFCTLPERQMVIYDTEKDEVKWQDRPPEWLKQKIYWQSRWLTINDSTAIIYEAVTGIRFVHINPKTLAFTYDKEVLLGSQICTAALLDREKRLWIGTENGLFVQNTKQGDLHPVSIPFAHTPLYHPYSHPAPIPFNSFLRRNNLLYVGNYHFLPLAVLDAETYKLKKFISFEKLPLPCNQIWSMLHYNQDTLWFATQDGLVWYDEKSSRYDRVLIPAIDTLLQGRPVSLLFKDTEGIIWMQTYWGSGVIRYNPTAKEIRRFTNDNQDSFLPLRVVNFVAEDGERNLWFAENGLIRWNRKKDAFDTLIQSYDGFNKDNVKIMSLNSDANGNLVLCNQNNGVLLFNPRSKKYYQTSTAQGLPENGIYFAVRTNNFLWVVSHNYITAVRQGDGKIISYSYADSLPQSLFNFAWNDQISNRMLFGYDNKVLWTSDRINISSTRQTPFYIDAFHVDGDTSFAFPSQNIELKHWQKNITIHYSAINFEDHSANRFAYRLNNEEWKPLGEETTLRLSSLSPDEYALEIKYYSVSNPEVEAVQKIHFVIHPPFWKTTWFYLLIALLLVGVSFVFYKKRVRQLKRIASIDRQLAEFEIKALHAQMNPHFVFNCLNSIREMILNGESGPASHYLSKFAHLLRITLNQSSQPFISLKDTVNYLKRYLEMELIRSAHFRYNIEVARELEPEEIYLPPMLIQPFIENAIWHGISNENEVMNIHIRFLQKEEQLLCIIEDTGIGIEASLQKKKASPFDHHSFGIENVKHRIQVLNEKYNLQSSLAIEDKSFSAAYTGTGTIVTLRLPIKNSSL